MAKVLAVALLLYAISYLSFFKRVLIANYAALMNYDAQAEVLLKDKKFIFNCKIVGAIAFVFSTAMLATLLYQIF